jgi:hypothetical protein
MGKTTLIDFERTGSLSSPPQILLAAVTYGSLRRRPDEKRHGYFLGENHQTCEQYEVKPQCAEREGDGT